MSFPMKTRLSYLTNCHKCRQPINTLADAWMDDAGNAFCTRKHARDQMAEARALKANQEEIKSASAFLHSMRDLMGKHLK